jgi:type I restriction enzyme S subunit
MNFFEKRLGYENLNKLSASTAQPVVSGSKIYSVEMLLPSFEEQRYIAASVDHFISVAEKIENTIDSELQKSEALRQSILKKAFSGQLVPQDPADEPASVLLERIRAEKIGQSPKKKPKEKKRVA